MASIGKPKIQIKKSDLNQAIIKKNNSLKNKNKEVTLREAQRNILPTANRLVNLWKETL